MTAWRNKNIRKSKRRAIVIRQKRMRARRKLETPQLFEPLLHIAIAKEHPIRYAKWLRKIRNQLRVNTRLEQAQHWRDKHGTPR